MLKAVANYSVVAADRIWAKNELTKLATASTLQTKLNSLVAIGDQS